MLTVVKIGGAVLDDSSMLATFVKEFVGIDGHKILVHGGGRTSSKLMEALEIPVEMIDGRRVTNAETLDVVTMAYSGLNKKLVAQLQCMKTKAVGLCGADENVISAVKRPPTPIDFGFVGDTSRSMVNAKVLFGYINHNIIPVLAPLTHDGKGQLLNTNADTIASVVAQAMTNFEEVRLIYAFEKVGLLWDVEDDNSIISEFHLNDLGRAVHDGHIHAGMIPKLTNAKNALSNGVSEVILCKNDEVCELKIKTRLLL